MAIKVPTFEQFKKERDKRTYEYSLESFLRNIHNALCHEYLEFIEIPFACFNPQDYKTVEKIVETLREKGFRLERKEDVPISAMSPQGIVTGTNVIHRCVLKDKEPTMKFVSTIKSEKSDKKEAKKKVAK